MDWLNIPTEWIEPSPVMIARRKPQLLFHSSGFQIDSAEESVPFCFVSGLILLMKSEGALLQEERNRRGFLIFEHLMSKCKLSACP